MFWNFSSEMSQPLATRFNPCEGFGCFGTSPLANPRKRNKVSIPVRDLDVLELRSRTHSSCVDHCFNPCEGFGCFGTPITAEALL